ncbi:helix-turn-helix transcriptional regulator [Halorussus amylolyticus]|uniref:helix-turn-helix transcriptional regulator n=1 Tax=Halorussus amylolyticus TaxID=1126242 RepID=UPI00138F164A|nr:transcriptional regulator FilR1 domain-containing protein [Halorussus amylolyticus]
MQIDRGIGLTKTVVTHHEILTLLRTEDALTTRQLERNLEYSRATVNRHLGTLREAELITATDNRHALTDFGAIVLREVEALCRQLHVSARLPELVEQLHACPIEFERSLLAEATVMTATADDPYQMHRRYLEFWDETERAKGVRSISAVPPDVVERLKPHLRGEVEAEIIWTPEAATRYFERYPDIESIWTGESDSGVRITDEPIPVQFGLFDHRLTFTVHDDRTGYPHALVDTADAEAVEWGRRLYRYYRERSQPMETWLDTTERAGVSEP